MKQAEAEAWKSNVLDEIFAALAESKKLDEALVFKGARVLSLRLGGGRQSLDIDSNLRGSFIEQFPTRDQQRTFLEEEMTQSIRRHFERQDPVRFELVRLQVKQHPPNGHPMGWDAFIVRLNVNDLTRNVRGLPALEIDVAAPEDLLDNSVSTIKIGGHEIRAYTLERITGEKLRAFLSSLPAYRAKLKKPGDTVRARDLYDISRIFRARNLTDTGFWHAVGQEFQLACRSRYIDCSGLATFQDQWDVTKKTYSEASIPQDIPFDEVENSLAAIVEFFGRVGVIPFSFELPESEQPDRG